MNKKLITLAVAAAMAAPAAAMAEATLYGVINQTIDYIDQDDGTDLKGNEVKGYQGWSVNRADGTIIPTNRGAGEGEGVLNLQSGNKSNVRLNGGNGPVGPSNRVGVKGSEDLGNGLKAIYQIEFGIATSDRDKDIDNGDRGNAVSMRNTFAGLAGDWGTFLVGRHDTPLKISSAKLDMFADTLGDYNGPLAFDDVRADNAVAYISPSWSGLQFAGAVIPGGGATVSGYNNAFSDSIAEGWSLALIFSNGPWYASAAYESMESDLGDIRFSDDFISNGVYIDSGIDEDADGFTDLWYPVLTESGVISPTEDYNKWRLGLGILDWNGFSLTGIYEDRENTGFVTDWDTQSWQIQAGFSFGNSMIKASYGQLLRDLDNLYDDDVVDDDDLGDLDSGDLDSWSIGFDHNFSKRTKVYAIYTGVNDELDLPNYTDWQGFSMGIVHKF
jgi:predicted porin